MKKFRVLVFKIKKNALSILFLIFTLCLVLFSSSNIQGARSGLKLWANSVVPSLFPFFIATELLSKTNVPRLLGKLFNKFMHPLFNISGEGSFAFIMGTLSRIPYWGQNCSKFQKK